MGVPGGRDDSERPVVSVSGLVAVSIRAPRRAGRASSPGFSASRTLVCSSLWTCRPPSPLPRKKN